MKRTTFGFTLIELLVIITVVSILLGVVLVNMGSVREQGRDAERKATMQTMASALELYKQKYGEYPAGCNGATVGTTPNWSGHPDSAYDCPGDSTEYIIGLAPEFIPELPQDPQLNGTNSGYVYTTNDELSVYKFMALNTVETETITEGHIYFRCGQEYRRNVTSCLDQSSIAACNASDDAEICEISPSSNTSKGTTRDHNPICTNSTNFATTYAVSAGFSSDARGASNKKIGREYDTEIVRCK